MVPMNSVIMPVYNGKTNDISIVICCHNSVKRLPETLRHLMHQRAPSNILWEVIVVDNASSDGTGELAQATWKEKPGVNFRLVTEPKIGLSNARNRGLQEAKGDLICFIDDDVRPHQDWLKNMVEFADQTGVDAIAGKVILPEGLCRPWMHQRHRTKLASTENIDPEKPQEMIGANMAFKRRILVKVPRFDPELGAGASGFGEESLFSRQILEAGFSIGYAEKAVVEHHFDERRLSRNFWLDNEKNRGKGKAFIAHHWEHAIIEKPFFEYLKYSLRLWNWRLKHPRRILKIDGCSLTEMGLVGKVAFMKQYMRERHKPRKYDYHGLVKLI